LWQIPLKKSADAQARLLAFGIAGRLRTRCSSARAQQFPLHVLAALDADGRGQRHRQVYVEPRVLPFGADRLDL
jgi:hypothetical protein